MQIINMIAFIVFIFVWTAVFIFVGLPNLYKMLGGSGWVYFMLPAIPIISLKYNFLCKLVWGIVCSLTALLLVNYMHSYFLLNDIQFPSFVRIYIIFVPVGLMLIGYLYAVLYFVDFNGDAFLYKTRYIEILKEFNLFFSTAFFTPVITFQSFVIIDMLSGFNYINNSLGYNIILSGLIVGALIFLIEANRIPIKVFNYFSRPILRFEYDFRKIKKWALISSLIFIVFSAHWEFAYRGHWGIWVETMIAFFILVYMLYKFGRIHFMSLPSRTEAPDEKYMPFIKTRRMIVIALIYFVVYIALIAAVLKGYARYLVY